MMDFNLSGHSETSRQKFQWLLDVFRDDVTKAVAAQESINVATDCRPKRYVKFSEGDRYRRQIKWPPPLVLTEPGFTPDAWRP